MAQNPKITFLFPFRWLTEDKEFFAENIKRMMERQGGTQVYELLETIPMYKVEIFYQYKEPIANFPFTKIQAQNALKPFFKNGKCIGVDFSYEQHRSQTMLPLCDFRLYFNVT